ncbi:MAG: S26 family signal peptidase [Planctomycetota bacterium]
MNAKPTGTDAEPAPETEPTSWEARHEPHWRHRINTFCENWIFAFIVAMAIRHFALEAYRIPSASMEPMLFGDPSFTAADHVVVDKLLFRFTGPDRYDVTVFQFPWPEVPGHGQPVRAWGGRAGPEGGFPFNPRLHRNFVKRCVVLPEDEFHIAHGDIFVHDGEGWDVAQKPPTVQSALWQEIYRHGAQPGYKPWYSDGAARVTIADAGHLELDFADDGSAIALLQPLRNLYVKRGEVRVLRRSARTNTLVRRSRAAEDRGRMAAAQAELLRRSQVVEASMIEPEFTIEGARGNIWRLEDWHLWRLTTADLDAQSHGKYLNDSMDEYVGDIRCTVLPTEMDGSLELVLRERAREGHYATAQELRLRLAEDGWSLSIDGKQVAAGDDTVRGHSWGLANLDGRALVYRDGERFGPVEPVRIENRDPRISRSEVLLAGTGTVRLRECVLDRDVHYCRNGFLADQTDEWMMALRTGEEALLHELLHLRRQMVTQLSDPELRAHLLAELERHDPASGGRPNRRHLDWLEPLGDSPERALRAPDNGYLLLGDNSPLSWDGRNWGWVPELNLRGEVLWVVLPLSRIKVVH